MEIYIAKFILIFIFILIISTLIAYFLVVKIGGSMVNSNYINISRKLKKVAMAWECKIKITYLNYPKIIGIRNNFSILLRFYDLIVSSETFSPRTSLQIKTNISKDTSLIILKKVKNKNAYPICVFKNINFIKTGNIELDNHYSFISNNEKKAKIIIKKIERLLFNRKHFFDNHEILQINKTGIEYEMDKIQTDEFSLTEKLSFIEEVVKRLKSKTA